MKRKVKRLRVVHRRPAEVEGPETTADIEKSVGLFSTVIAGVEDGVPRMHGSGTLVTVDGRGCFLTAHHVVYGKGPKRGLLSFEGLCVWLSRQGQQPVVPQALFTGVSIAAPTTRAGDPDLGALLLPEHVVSACKTRQKAFYNLDRHPGRDIQVVAAAPGALIVLAGAPAEYTEVTPQGLVSEFLFGYGRSVTVKHRNGFMYLSLHVDYRSPAKPPRSFEGMSGGGLWVIPTRPDQKGTPRVSGSAILSGVAFRQIVREGRVTSVRCHGDADIYERARKEISKAICEQPFWPGLREALSDIVPM